MRVCVCVCVCVYHRVKVSVRPQQPHTDMPGECPEKPACVIGVHRVC